MTFTTWVTKLTLVAKGSLRSFEKVFVLRGLNYFSVSWLKECSKIKAKSLHKGEDPPPPNQESAPLMPVKNGRSPAELNLGRTLSLSNNFTLSHQLERKLLILMN